jgi:hypothetical protein
MMEPLVPTRPMKIAPTETPAPPWTGQVFVCDKCGAENQLEAADVCVPLNPPDGEHYLTPRCPTDGCGYISVIMLPESALGLMRLGLESDVAGENEPEQVGNAS